MQLNADKCKELRIDFTLVKHYFELLSVNRLDISVVESAIMLLRISLICAFCIFSRFRTAFDDVSILNGVVSFLNYSVYSSFT
jgi:hypothetical protein